jgi:heme exporter protein CcmD
MNLSGPGHAIFVWAAFAVTFAALAIEALVVWLSGARAARRANQECAGRGTSLRIVTRETLEGQGHET